MDETLSSKVNRVGDTFRVVVVHDVTDRGFLVIPAGTVGRGEVTFSTQKGGFGRAGLLGISLRTLDLNGKSFALDGRYREEGKDNGGAAGAVVFTAGVLGALVKGKTSIIPKGRELKARTGEDITYPAAHATRPAPAFADVSTGAAPSAAPAIGTPEPAAAAPKIN